MKKLLVALVSAAVMTLGFVPAQAAGEYVARQKTLSDAIGSAIALNSKQKSEIKQVVDANPYAEKFICTGIRLEGQPLRMNIVVRKRAKAACDYAKQLNPALSTWFQNKPTKAPSYNGRVLLTLKIPADKANAVPEGYVETEAINWKINPDYKVGKPCEGFGWQVLGLNSKNQLAYLRCSNPQGGVFRVDTSMVKFDPFTKKPLVPEAVPSKTKFGYSPNLYIVPQIVDTLPSTVLSAGSFSDYSQCKIAEPAGVGRPDKSFGFPLPESRLDLGEDFKILVVPVQFDDHQTSNRPADDMADVVSALTNFYTRASSVPISFDWTIPDSYYQMGRTLKSFELQTWKPDFSVNFMDSDEPYIEAALAVADDDFDFRDFDMVIVEEPRTVTNQEHGSYVPHAQENGGTQMDTNDGPVRSILITGNDQYRDISNWVHEFGHLLGLPDNNANVDTGQSFGIMWGWYGAPELTAWSRWQLEILKDSQVDCKTDIATSTHLVQPVAWTGDYQKAVVIPVSDHEVIVVESRRRQGYDALLGKESEGAYVYRIDTSAKMYEPDTKKISQTLFPERSKKVAGRWRMDASLKLGESVTSDGWTITVKETGSFGDVVEVKKAS